MRGTAAGSTLTVSAGGGVNTINVGSGGPPPGASTINAILGLVIIDGGGAKTTGLGLVGFESGSGKFTSVWTDSRQTRMSLRQSEDPFTGDQIVLYGRSLDGDGKGARRSRTVTRLEDCGRKIVHRQYVPEPNSKERVIMELVMTRKGAAPGAEK